MVGCCLVVLVFKSMKVFLAFQNSSGKSDWCLSCLPLAVAFVVPYTPDVDLVNPGNLAGIQTTNLLLQRQLSLHHPAAVQLYFDCQWECEKEKCQDFNYAKINFIATSWWAEETTEKSSVQPHESVLKLLTTEMDEVPFQ